MLSSTLRLYRDFARGKAWWGHQGRRRRPGLAQAVWSRAGDSPLGAVPKCDCGWQAPRRVRGRGSRLPL